ncbi:MAG: TonB-dependent receptor [Bacteroidia bacterium]|nr:TonB-dependent receptor [Bacteroidia bacterium]
MYKKILWSIAALLAFTSTLKAQEDVKDYELDEVVVTATRMKLPLKSIPQKVEIIDKSKILSVPNENLADLLKRTTNLDIVQYPGSSAAVGMRGFAPSIHNRNYTLVLIDGKPVGTTNLTAIPSDFVERIEVIKGPYSVLYGSDAMGGVINIITKQPSIQKTGSVSVSAGNFGQTNINGYASGGISDKVRISLGFSRKVQEKDYRIGSRNIFSLNKTEKLILDEKSYGDAMGNTQYSINQFMGKVLVSFDNLWSADITGAFVTSNDIETPGNYWHSYGLSKKDFNRFNTSLDLRRESYNNTLLISPYWSAYKESNYNNSESDAFINSKDDIKQYGIKISDTYSWGDFKLVGGIDIDANKISSKRFSDKITPMNPYRPDHSSLATSVFAQGAYTLDKLFVNAGVRYNYTNFTLEASELLKNEKKSTGYSNFSPSLGFKYFIVPNINIHGSFGTSFFVPDAYKVAGKYQVGQKEYRGEPNLKAETATSFDLGLNLTNNRFLSIDITYFQTFYKNKIVNDNSSKDFITFKNADKGRMNGLEIMFSSDIAQLFSQKYNLELYAAFTHMFNNSFEKEGVMKDIIGVRKTTGNFGIAFNNNKEFTTRLNARYIGNRLENDWLVWSNPNPRPDIKAEDYYTKGGYTASEQILQHPAHLVFDYSVFYNVTPKARIGISVSNLFDENYTEKDGYNMPGRNIMGHASYSF